MWFLTSEITDNSDKWKLVRLSFEESSKGEMELEEEILAENESDLVDVINTMLPRRRILCIQYFEKKARLIKGDNVRCSEMKIA